VSTPGPVAPLQMAGSPARSTAHRGGTVAVPGYQQQTAARRAHTHGHPAPRLWRQRPPSTSPLPPVTPTSPHTGSRGVFFREHLPEAILHNPATRCQATKGRRQAVAGRGSSRSSLLDVGWSCPEFPPTPASAGEGPDAQGSVLTGPRTDVVMPNGARPRRQLKAQGGAPLGIQPLTRAPQALLTGAGPTLRAQCRHAASRNDGRTASPLRTHCHRHLIPLGNDGCYGQHGASPSVTCPSRGLGGASHLRLSAA